MHLQMVLEGIQQVGESTSFETLSPLLNKQSQLCATMQMHNNWIALIEEQTPQLSAEYLQKKRKVLALVDQLAEQAQHLELLFVKRQKELHQLLQYPLVSRRPGSALKVATLSGRIDLNI